MPHDNAQSTPSTLMPTLGSAALNALGLALVLLIDAPWWAAAIASALLAASLFDAALELWERRQPAESQEPALLPLVTDTK